VLDARGAVVGRRWCAGTGCKSAGRSGAQLTPLCPRPPRPPCAVCDVRQAGKPSTVAGLLLPFHRDALLAN
jgi:hypothetical protein